MSPDQPPRVEAVVVRSATLPPSPADAAFSIIHLSGDEIRGRARLDEALSEVPGFSLFRRTSSLGANPTTQGVSLRGIAGSGASRALVTLDGVPQNDPFGGWVIWSRLIPSDIAGAAIVRGAGAGPYGAGALTGVVALTETEPAPGAWRGDAKFGSLGLAGGSVLAGLAAGPGILTISAAVEHSGGWIPVIVGRGQADRALTLTDRSVSLNYRVESAGLTEALRAAAYQEDRGSGLVGAASRSRGVQGSFSVARAPTATSPGWRAQAWVLATDLANTSVSVATGRQTTLLANNQYETPAVGYGVNAAWRRLWPWGTLEVGIDGRGAAGEDHEFFRSVAGALTRGRVAGGQTLTGGGYAEASARRGALLITANARIDGWDTFDSHRLEHDLATGVATLDLHPGGRSGAFPSERVGARWALGGGQWLRGAGYTGFRAPTLNELFRPFRVGNNITEANANLTPEKLFGVEAGAGGDVGSARWSLTGFYNRLVNPITNVTVGRGPFTDPVAGFVPAGGILYQRRNIGAVNAYGVEGEASVPLLATVRTDIAFDWTRARVDGGATAGRLTGLRPAQTPETTVTGGLTWAPRRAVMLEGRFRYEGARFEDDLNTLRLGGAVAFDMTARWRIRRGLRVFVSAANLLDDRAATGETADHVFSRGPPRTISVGVAISGGPE